MLELPGEQRKDTEGKEIIYDDAFIQLKMTLKQCSVALMVLTYCQKQWFAQQNCK